MRARPGLLDQRSLASRTEVLTEETEGEESLIRTPKTKKGKTRERKRKVLEKPLVDQRRKASQSLIENASQDSAEKKMSVEVVLSESLEERYESQAEGSVHIEISSESEDETDQKKVNTPVETKESESGDIIDLTGEEDGEGLSMSDLMKF